MRGGKGNGYEEASIIHFVRTSGVYNRQVSTWSIRRIQSGHGQSGRPPVTFIVAGATLPATVDRSGNASVTAPALLLPGTYAVQVQFGADSHYLASVVETTLAVGNTAGKVTAGSLHTPERGRGGSTVHSDGTKAWFSGIGRGGEPFVAYAEDNGKPEKGDRLQLWIGGVPANGDGSLNGGKVKIHR